MFSAAHRPVAVAVEIDADVPIDVSALANPATSRVTVFIVNADSQQQTTITVSPSRAAATWSLKSIVNGPDRSMFTDPPRGTCPRGHVIGWRARAFTLLVDDLHNESQKSTLGGTHPVDDTSTSPIANRVVDIKPRYVMRTDRKRDDRGEPPTTTSAFDLVRADGHGQDALVMRRKA